MRVLARPQRVGNSFFDVIFTDTEAPQSCILSQGLLVHFTQVTVDATEELVRSWHNANDTSLTGMILQNDESDYTTEIMRWQFLVLNVSKYILTCKTSTQPWTYYYNKWTSRSIYRIYVSWDGNWWQVDLEPNTPNTQRLCVKVIQGFCFLSKLNIWYPRQNTFILSGCWGCYFLELVFITIT